MGHQLKCVTSYGLHLGFRSNKEYCDLKVHDANVGKFEVFHPCNFCGDQIDAKNLCDKTTKISLKNGHVQLENNKLRLPILSLTNPNDPGGMLCRCIEKRSPD